MITSKIQKIVAHSLVVRYNYISKRALDEIQKAHGKTFFQRTLMYTKQARHIAKEGLYSFKKDLEDYFKIVVIEKVDKLPLTAEQIKLKKKIEQDLGKLKPIVLINLLPFASPLLIFYIITYPTKVPSYFCLDQLFQLHQKESVVKQAQAVEIFKQKPIDPSTFSLAKLTLEQLKLLSQLLFGHFEDGVVGINKYFKHNPKSYLVHPHFSKHLVIRKIKQELKNDIEAHKELQNLSNQELVLWKYERVMKGEDRVVFKPITNHLQPVIDAEVTPEVQSNETAKEQHHTRHNPTHRPNPHAGEHERHPHHSSTRKNK